MEQAIAGLTRRRSSAVQTNQIVDDDLSRKASDLYRDELYQRLGWMPRVHPIVLPSGRWILPLYTDTFSASIMAISDDRGADLDGEQAVDRLRQHPAEPGAQERR